MGPVICLLGPTAAGKTALAVRLVQDFPCDIVSVDSAMVYCGMDIGTAKPDAATLALAPHRLIDIRSPRESYSAAQFCQDAAIEIKQIIANKRIPLLVGGTMLYFRALQQGLSNLPSANPVIRQQLTEEALKLGWPYLHERLSQVDPLAAKRIHPQDGQRIQRALEVFMLTQKSLSEWQQFKDPNLLPFQFYNLAVAPNDRAILHQRIEARFKQMLVDGFVSEVESLLQSKELLLDSPALRSVGYFEVWEYLTGKTTANEMEQRGIIATRQLAKRQLTWLRSWPSIIWLNSEDPKVYDELKRAVEGFLT